MNLRGIFSLSAIAVLALAWFPGHAVSQQKSIRDQLVGTWMLVVSESLRPDGSKVDEYGQDPKGTLIFDKNGRYSVTIMRADLPNPRLCVRPLQNDDGTAPQNSRFSFGRRRTAGLKFGGRRAGTERR
jgi:hypothetical protein